MTARITTIARRSLAGGVGLLLVVGFLGLRAPEARADSAPLNPSNPATPATVTADGLPTVQIDGVVWSQVVVGNTVYAAGKFGNARPAGAAPGTQQTVRNNMLAYDIRTGDLVTSFAPDLNGQALSVTASPDGKRVYVGGDFTTANGQPRSHVAAYDTATGQLVAAFHPAVSGQVRAVAATDTTVYFGGNVTAVGSVARTRLAAVSAADGSLLPWAPVANASTATDGSNEVLAMVVTSGGSQVVVGGRFVGLNGVAATGVGALDAATGATMPFAVNKIVTNEGINSGIWGLSTDGKVVYGSAYDYYGPGNLEGTFAADADGGALRSVAYCRGDNYSSFATNEVLYIASHMHDCHYIGGYPDQNPQVFKRATAVSLAVTGKVSDYFGNTNFVGAPAPSLLDWFPLLAMGTYTGQYQAAWSVVGNSQYVAYAGEFPRVNDIGQQGLVRFAVPSIAPNKIGPSTDGLTPTLTVLGSGAVRIAWKVTNDQDNEYLTYRVYRDGATTPIYQVSRPSTWWNMPAMSVGDSGLSAGSHRYQVTASDPAGNVARSTWTSVDVATGGTARPYADAVRADGASDHWSLGEASGRTAYDLDGTKDMTLATGATLGAAGALTGDADTAVALNGTSSGYLSTRTAVPGPQTFTVEAWFQTSSNSGGRIVGFSSASTGTSSSYDRHVYLDTSGRLNFGVSSGGQRVVTSSAAYNDGKWHHVAATLGSGGMALYADGRLVGSRADTTSAQVYNGYWRVGADRAWAGAASFNGRIDEVAVYPTVLSADQVAAHVAVGVTGKPGNQAPSAAFTSAVDYLVASFDASGSLDTDGTVSSYAWKFGDGATATGRTAAHSYSAPGTYPVTLTVTDDAGATGTTTASVTVTAPPPNVAPTADFVAAGAGRTGSFDASASQDSDGTIADYSWNFGDGATGSGVRASHAYASDGTYTVTLTVTDNDGATATTQRTITVASSVLASDSFARSVTGGLGTADAGGAWTVSAGGARQSVASGAATFALTKGTNTGSYLGAVAQTSADVRTTISLSAVPTGGGASIYVMPRRVDAINAYEAQLRILADGSVGVSMMRLTTAGEALIGTEAVVKGLTYTAGTPLDVRVQASGTGTTDLAATVWPAGSAEPTTPTVTRTDTTAALQAPGALGLTAYLSGSATAPVNLTFTDFTAAPVGTNPPPANKAPQAAFVSSVDGLAASVDGSGSTDADGTVAGYAWDFGDQTSGSGRTATHSYAAAGTYTVRLTVTDDKGATGTVERTVTVTAPAPPPPGPTVIASDSFQRTVTGGLGTADTGGPWTVWAGGPRQSVASGTATYAMAKGTNTGSYLGGVSQTSADVRTSFSLSAVPTGGGAMVYVGVRQVALNTAYKARVRVLSDGSVHVAFIRLAGTTDDVMIGAEVTVPGLTYTAGTPLNVRVQASGSGTTALAATVWAAGDQPGTPTVTRSDSTAELQAPGAVGLSAYLSSSATAPVELHWNSYSVTPVA